MLRSCARFSFRNDPLLLTNCELQANDVDLHLVPAHRPFLIPSKKEQMQNAEFVLSEIKSRQSEYAEFRRRGEDSLRSSVATRTQGDKGVSAFAAKVKSRQLHNVARETALDAVEQARLEGVPVGEVLAKKTTLHQDTTVPRNRLSKAAGK